MSSPRCARTDKAPLSRAEAERQAAYWNRRWRTPEREAYRCRHCRGWHTARKLVAVGTVVPPSPATPPASVRVVAAPRLFD